MKQTDLRKKSVMELAKRLNNIEVEKYNLDLEYNQIIHELWRRIPDLKSDVNVQPKDTLNEVIDKLLNETYQDEIDEHTRAYPLNNCCKERLNVVKKRVRK